MVGALWLLLGSYCAQAQAPLRKDLKKDFGAVGDGRTNDQAAFARAAEFFNKRAQKPAGAGRAVLRIPKGIYLVGQAGAGTMGSLLYLNGCRNLAILGEDSATTEIRYADNLHYGTFDAANQAPYEAPTAYYTGSYAAGLGTCLDLQNCENIEIADLTLNGNSPHLLVGGHWGDVGIQLGADGLGVGNSRRIRLRRLAVHHFGRDGIQVLSHLGKGLDDPAREEVLLENSRFDYNGRQGLSLTGINGLRATNCSFSHTGRVLIPGLGKPLYSNPGAGVDVEPEGGYAVNVRFERCRLVDNAGQALVSDRYGSGPPTVKNVVLHDCLLWGVTNWSAWVRQTGFLFEDCRIYGAFVTGCAFATAGTRFVGCTFEDRPYHGQPAYGPYLLYSNREARRMSFVNCRFVGTHGYFMQARPADADTASYFRLRGCTFEYAYAEPPLGAADSLLGVVWRGTTVFKAGRPGGSPAGQTFVLGGAGSPALVQAPASLRLLAPGVRYLVPGGLDVGRPAGRVVGAASVLVGEGSTLVMNDMSGKMPELYVGPRSQLVVKKGGSLALLAHTKVTIAGQLLVEDGGYFFCDPQAVVELVGRGQLRLAEGVIKNVRPNGQVVD